MIIYDYSIVCSLYHHLSCYHIDIRIICRIVPTVDAKCPMWACDY